MHKCYMDLCPTCRKFIYRTDPCKGVDVECGRTDGGPKKSTAARKDVRGGNEADPQAHPTEVAKRSVAKVSLTGPKASAQSPGSQAGTQAPPVDASNLIVAVDYGRQDETAELIGKVKPDGNIEILSLTVRGTPRKRKPKGTFDRKTYQREAARDRRAKLKARKGE